VYENVFKNGYVADKPLVIRRMNGKFTDVFFNGSVYKDDQENVIGVVLVARDVTAQKQFENELIEAKMKAECATLKAEEAVKAKQQFLSNMSHEIRTPMNAIIGFTKVVLKTELTKEQNEYVTAIKTSGDSLTVLIDDILDLAKVDSGKMVFEKSPFKLSNSISFISQLFELKVRENNLKWLAEVDPAIPEVIIGDISRLHQIMMNLIGNAVKFTSKGSIKLRVKLLNEDKDKMLLEFSIEDTGIGISPEMIHSIFENFQQASNNTTRFYGGTGLGLAISKKLIELQGGNIQVKSQLDLGSVFSFTLPFQKTTFLLKEEVNNLIINNNRKDVKILVVEDIALNQLLMKTILEDFGFEQDMAENGQIAIEKLKLKKYDLILMDLQMPIMNGFETTDYIRNILDLTIPIIALTADVTSVDLDKCKTFGMNDYISKPVDETILYSKIVSFL
jgi:signal transduction histidine kinase/CheY-like chemotaxis protein